MLVCSNPGACAGEEQSKAMGLCGPSRWQIHFKHTRRSYTLGTEAEQVPGKYRLQLKDGSLEIESSPCSVAAM